MSKLYDLLHTIIGKVNASIKTEEQNLTDAEKEQARKNIGAVTDYLKLSNRPTETIGGDTLTWDGNTEGLVSAEGGFYKLSDVVLSADDVANGCVITVCSGGESESSEATVDTSLSGMIQIISEAFAVISVTDATTYGFPENGTYFMYSMGIFISSLTIPGYTGFTKEVIKQEVLPEALQFGEVYGDTLTWDGNTEGLVSVDVGGNILYKISNAVPTINDFANGYEVEADGVKYTHSADAVQDAGEGVLGLADGLGMFIPDNAIGIDFGGFTFPESGFYVPIVTTSLTIPGYAGFPSVKKVQEKYLPKIPTIVELDFATGKLSHTPREISDMVNAGGMVLCSVTGTVFNTTQDSEENIIASTSAMMYEGADADGSMLMLVTTVEFDKDGYLSAQKVAGFKATPLG